jgi:transposase-like protein
MSEWIEVKIKVTCPNDNSENVKRISGVVLDCNPPIEPFICLDCGKEFMSRSFEIKPIA